MGHTGPRAAAEEGDRGSVDAAGGSVGGSLAEGTRDGDHCGLESGDDNVVVVLLLIRGGWKSNEEEEEEEDEVGWVIGRGIYLTRACVRR